MEIKLDVFIRADGSSTIGLGHLVRCAGLAHMLKADFQITFYCKEIPDALAGEFEAAGFGVRKIETEEAFLQALKPNQIVVLDGYGFDTDYQRRVRDKGCRLVCIDDLHDREFLADLIINHAPGITPRDYKAQPYTRFALGPDYALLRPAFLEQANKERKIEKMETLLIAFGGADPKRLTEKTLKAALEFSTFKKIILVTGAAFKINDAFLQLVAADQKIEHRQSLNEEQMLHTMLEADLAMLPASGILFEALAAGCIVVSGCYAENQKLVYENFKNTGSFYDAGGFGPEEIRKAIEYALTQSKTEKTIIDGNSNKRILKIFKEIEKESVISLRSAQKEDLELTFDWASNQEIRRYSFQQHQIRLQEHTSWFLGKVNQPDCVYLIGEMVKKPFGSIRFDIKNNEAIISYLVDPGFHGQGLGLLLLKKGIEKLMIEKNLNDIPVNAISGFVMKPNMPSIKAFEHLGFEKVAFEDKFKFVKQI